MKLLRKVPSIEAKRCFVLSQRFTSKKIRNKTILRGKQRVSSDSFVADIREQKKKVLTLNEKSLDKIIKSEYILRYKIYNDLEWYIGEVSTNEVCLWRWAGGLHRSWTERKTLYQTAQLFYKEFKKNTSRLKRVRAYSVVSEIISQKDIISQERYLLPIAVPTGSYKEHRAGIRTIPLFLDDGNMRSLAYAISGEKKIMMYVGVKKQKVIS